MNHRDFVCDENVLFYSTIRYPPYPIIINWWLLIYIIYKATQIIIVNHLFFVSRWYSDAEVGQRNFLKKAIMLNKILNIDFCHFCTQKKALREILYINFTTLSEEIVCYKSQVSCYSIKEWYAVTQNVCDSISNLTRWSVLICDF